MHTIALAQPPVSLMVESKATPGKVGKVNKTKEEDDSRERMADSFFPTGMNKN